MAPAYDLAQSLKDFRAEANTVWPGRDRASDGWIGDTDHKARPSDHNPDRSVPVPLVRAYDIDKDGPSSLQIGGLIAEHLRQSRDPRIKYVIWNGRMFASYDRAGRPAWTWGPYDGINAHRQHVHLSVLPGPAGARGGGWGLLTLAARPDNPLTPPEDPDMAFDDRAAQLLIDTATNAKETRRMLAVVLGVLPPAPGESRPDVQVDVDEAEVARLVLAGLPAERIAAAIPDTLAREVADIIGSRLAAQEG